MKEGRREVSFGRDKWNRRLATVLRLTGLNSLLYSSILEGQEGLSSADRICPYLPYQKNWEIKIAYLNDLE